MAKTDLIDRTALLAELEGLKAILGDVFLGMVVERAIERVKAQPVVGVMPKCPVIKSCDSCRHFAVHSEDEPCRSCVGTPGAVFPNWEGPDD